MYVNVVFIAMTLNPHMASLILNLKSSHLTNIDCENKECNSNASFQFYLVYIKLAVKFIIL